ncbi:MAG: universal stress protein [Acidimicrobiia bacterium]
MYGRILVGTDGSKTAARAVARAVDVAQAMGATLTVVTVDDNEERGRQTAEEAVERHRSTGVEIDVRTAPGDAPSALVEMSEGYDLLVLGNKGMTGLSRFMLGSVPNKVSHHVPCSLLIVRTT